MKIFNSIKINNLRFRNRFSVASMCQYSAKNGNPSSWHYSHLGRLAQTGAGLLMLESTAVNLQGRISKKDLTLINKKNEIELKRLVKFIINKLILF